MAYLKRLETIARERGENSLTVFRGFAGVAACAWSGGRREDEYLQEAQRWKPSHLSRFAEALGALCLMQVSSG